MTLAVVIQYLIVAVLIVTFFAVARLYYVLGNVRQTLANLETTRTEISSTLKRLETVAQSTQKVLEDELTPTLRVARETLVNVEVTTRALAETTQAVRRLTGKAESVVSAQQLLKVGGPLLQQVAMRSAGAFSGLFAGIGAGVRAVLGGGRPRLPALRRPTATRKFSPKRCPPDADNKRAISPKASPKTGASGGKKR